MTSFRNDFIPYTCYDYIHLFTAISPLVNHTLLQFDSFNTHMHMINVVLIANAVGFASINGPFWDMIIILSANMIIWANLC